MVYTKKQKRGSGKGKLLLFFVLLVVGGLAFLASQDMPPPTKTITKTIEHPALTQ